MTLRQAIYWRRRTREAREAEADAIRKAREQGGQGGKKKGPRR